MSKKPQTGQVDILGNIHGLEKLVVKPEVVQQDGLKVIHFAISEGDKKIKGYLDTVLKEARKLEPEVKSRGRPPWMDANYLARKRKRKAEGRY